MLPAAIRQIRRTVTVAESTSFTVTGSKVLSVPLKYVSFVLALLLVKIGASFMAIPVIFLIPVAAGLTPSDTDVSIRKDVL